MEKPHPGIPVSQRCSSSRMIVVDPTIQLLFGLVSRGKKQIPSGVRKRLYFGVFLFGGIVSEHDMAETAIPGFHS
jgi:hypothetical protein